MENEKPTPIHYTLHRESHYTQQHSARGPEKGKGRGGCDVKKKKGVKTGVYQPTRSTHILGKKVYLRGKTGLGGGRGARGDADMGLTLKREKKIPPSVQGSARKGGETARGETRDRII